MAEAAVAGRRASYASRIALCLIANYCVLAVLADRSQRSPVAAVVSATIFWSAMVAFPHGVNRRALFSPRNYIAFLFFFSMVVGPAVMLFGELLPRLWILSSATWDTQRVYSYMLPAALLWGAALLTYLVSQRPGRRVSVDPSPVRGEEREPPADWMLITGMGLILAGVIGLTIATGSVLGAFSLGGKRAAARAVLGAGTYRFSGWMEGVPLGAALVWYYVTQRRRMGKVGGALWVALLYVPLFPLYLYTAGRARALIPLLLLLALYHRYVYRFSAKVLVVALCVLIPTMSLWALYRAGGRDVELRGEGVNTVLAADFSRFEVSTVALAGFQESKLGYFWGKTFRTALTYWVPTLRGRGRVDGTAATAKALAGTRSWNLPVSYATSLVTESYLNFGVLGIVLVFAALGRLVAWLDEKAASTRVLMMLLSLGMVLKLPFLVSTSISAGQLVWAVAFPYAVAWLVRSVLGSTVRKPRMSQAARRPAVVSG
ncbi:MAG: O-antigen polysaccharide polymerase Wzy [Acidimicrobiaceae bacterium]|nr:O-antigen polysaccharide polymerase Wzy [Acidimicrobiaceae bacterium]